ncbi:MAG: hypothetical protein M3O84_08980 [Actinomycetota bacterium]|nr:hypothetical protein [Actinomycetota bacterium]
MAVSGTLMARRSGGWMWFAILVGVALAVLLVGASTPDVQMFLALTGIIAVVAALLIPRAVAREPSISPRFLAVALMAHVVGSLLRYFIIQAVYHGVADANGYFAGGVQYAPQFRSLQLPAFPGVGTPFMNWLTGILFAFTGPTMLGGFVVCAALSFVGSWYFYKAFRVAFPEGNHQLFAVLIFLFPTMWYWTSSLGKDAVVMLFLGIATYGFALLFRSISFRAIVAVALGLTVVALIRPPIAASEAVAAAAAFLLRPARARAPQVQALLWLLFVPVLSVAAFTIIRSSQAYIRHDSPVEAFEAQQTSDFNSSGGISDFTAISPFTAKGFPLAIVTVNFRPFPWEAGGLLPAVAAMEGIVLAGVLFLNRRAIFAGLRHWRSNGMVILAVGSFLSISVILSALSNFGLLARQRTQVLPFLFMLPCMVRVSRRQARVPAAR